MVVGEKIIIHRCSNGWIVVTDLRPMPDGTNQDRSEVAKTVDEALSLVRASMVDPDATSSAEGSGRVQ